MIKTSKYWGVALQTVCFAVITMVFATNIMAIFGTPYDKRDALVGLSLIIVNAALIWVFTMLFKRNFNWKYCAPVLVLGHISGEMELLARVFHNAVKYLSVYDYLFLFSKNVENEQGGLIIAYSLVLVALIFQVSRKKYRTFDRAAALIITLSMCLTWALFHANTVSSVKVQRLAEADLIKSYINTIKEFNRCEVFAFKCFSFDKTLDVKLDEYEFIRNDLTRILPYVHERIDGEFFHAWYGSSPLEAKLGNNYVVAIYREPNTVLADIIISTKRPQARMLFEEARMSLSLFLAHFVWLIGGWGVCFIHSKRARAYKLKAVINGIK